MAERTHSTRALNRALLARQLLLERATLSIPGALEKVGGLQDQYAPSAYIGLWSRLRDFDREALTKALEDRKAVQGTLMRSTIHVVSARDYPLMAEGTRQARRDWWLRAQRHQETPNMEKAARRLQEHLEGGPRRQDELIKLLHADGFAPMAWSGARLWLDMVRVPPSGTWNQRRADLHGLASRWLPPSEPTAGEGLEHLLRRYLGGFGPAPLSDAASWAGVPLSALRQAMQGLTLRRFRDDKGQELLDLPGASLPDPDTPAPVRFLPTWDASLLSARAPYAGSPRDLPADGLQHQDSTFGAHVPGRRSGGGHLALRARSRPGNCFCNPGPRRKTRPAGRGGAPFRLPLRPVRQVKSQGILSRFTGQPQVCA